MSKKIWIPILGVLLLASTFVNALEGVKLSIDPFFKIPDEYKAQCQDDFVTVVKVEGLPDKSVLHITQSNIFEESKKNLIIKSTNGTAGLIVTSLGYIPGMPVTYRFQDHKNKIDETITFVPYPLYAKSVKDDAKVEVTLVSAVMYTGELTGFKKQEKVLFQTIFPEGIAETEIDMSQDYGFMVLPEDVNKGGIVKLKFTRPCGEVLTLELPWGLELLKYSLYYDKEGKVKQAIDSEKVLKEYPELDNYFNKKQCKKENQTKPKRKPTCKFKQKSRRKLK